MYRGSKIVPIRIPPDILGQIETDVASVNKRRKKKKVSVGEWIRAAIKLKLDQKKRGKKCRAKRVILCSHCGKELAEKDVAFSLERLDGIMEYCCEACDN